MDGICNRLDKVLPSSDNPTNPPALSDNFDKVNPHPTKPSKVHGKKRKTRCDNDNSNSYFEDHFITNAIEYLRFCSGVNRTPNYSPRTNPFKRVNNSF